MAAMVALSVLPAKAWDNMYLIGTATTAGHSLEKAVQMTGNGDQFVWTGTLKKGDFKLLVHTDGWYDMYGPANNQFSEVSDGTSYNKLVLNATYALQFFSTDNPNPANPQHADYKWKVDEERTYTIRVNTTTMQMTTYPAEIYPVGGGCEVGWSTSGNVAFKETAFASGIYQGSLELKAESDREIKFLTLKEYGPHFGPKNPTDGNRDLSGYGVFDTKFYTENDQKFYVLNGAAGKYNMTLNANTGKLYIVPQQISIKAQIEMGALEEMETVNCHVWTELVPGEAKDIVDIVPTEDGWFEAKVTGVYGPINFLYNGNKWNVQTPDMKNDENGYYTDKSCTVYAEKVLVGEKYRLKCLHNDDNTLLNQTITLEFKVAQDTTWVGENTMYLYEWQNQLNNESVGYDKYNISMANIQDGGIYTFADIPVVNKVKFVLQTESEGYHELTAETSTYKSQKYWISKENGAYKLIATENFDKDPTTSVEQTSVVNDNIVYDIMGRALGTSLENLPQGIYVRNGKKFVVAQ